MSLYGYIKDKRFFVIFYLLIITFVSIILYTNIDQHAWSVILYTYISCLVFACMYIAVGYYYRKKFYQSLRELTEHPHDVLVSLLPESQNENQRLFVNVIKNIVQDHTHQLQKLQEEKKEHQEYILSWIHEIKLPIAASKLLLEHSEDKSKEWLNDHLEDELGKIEDYVEQALYYSRIDTFNKDYFITEVHVGQIVKNTVKKYAKLFINKGIHFHMENSELTVQSDKKWLGFVLDQLMANALKYTDVGGNISVSFEEDSNEKRVRLHDDGIGIKSEDIDRVFDRGFTGTTGRNHTKSTGMGLYLAKKLANKLEYELTIESEEGVYTTAVIHVPKVRNYYRL